MADNNSGNQKPSLSWSQPASTPAKPAAPAASATPAPNASKSMAANTKAVDSTSNAGVYIGIFVAGLIVGALVGWGISASRGGGASTTASSTSMTASSTNSTSGGTNVSAVTGSTIGKAGNISVAAQQAGFAVAVTKVSVQAPTWLVVYDDHNGVRGNALGAELFFPGETNGTISLIRATMSGQSYFVGQNVDNGDKTFSTQTDKPVTDEQGNPLFTEFKAE